MLQAGISGRANYLKATKDTDGTLQELDHSTLEVNLKAVANTAHLALHHFQHQSLAGGSLVLNASAAAYQRFRIVDYGMAKHGVLGLIRGLHSAVSAAGLNVRVNGVSGPASRDPVHDADANRLDGAQLDNNRHGSRDRHERSWLRVAKRGGSGE
jgi:NAD(P)-dependent dehydrogenase (short-subunit alcohol dehydrogenase family)